MNAVFTSQMQLVRNQLL